MAILIGAQKLSKSFTARPLFKDISFSVETGERVGLIGPNGAGKSTLLKILAGKATPDDGNLSVQRGLRIGFLEQVPLFSKGLTVEETVAESVSDPHDWEQMVLVQEMMSKTDLTPSFGIESDTLVETLSGGVKKRVALARELVKKPDLLLLDEPTNHLDMESILWLEDFLSVSSFATVTITHDRLFLQRVSNRILELDRRHKDGLLSVKGDYASFIEAREDLLTAQELHEQKMKNTLRRETEWLRRGAKARQTKQQARIKNAGELKKEVEEIEFRNQKTLAKLEFQTLEKNPKKLIEAKNISKYYGNKLIVPDLDLLITPKSRIGLLGRNGSGKSTLIKILLGEEKSDSGTVVHAERLKPAYFEQNRESLNPNETLINTICPKGEWVDFQGQKVHIKSYLSRFLFNYEQMGLAVGKLSGGEQSRLSLARLMLTEANVLILDEPTNDLDVATLDVLADVLKEFNGAVILVTHDRFFLDQVTNYTLCFGMDRQGQKTVTPLSGMEQWETWVEEQISNRKLSSNIGLQKETGSSGDGSTGISKKRKLTYKEQREYDGLEAKIHKAEGKLSLLESEISKPENATNAVKLLELSSEIQKLKSEIEVMCERWVQLSLALRE